MSFGPAMSRWHTSKAAASCFLSLIVLFSFSIFQLFCCLIFEHFPDSLCTSINANLVWKLVFFCLWLKVSCVLCFCNWWRPLYDWLALGSIEPCDEWVVVASLWLLLNGKCFTYIQPRKLKIAIIYELSLEPSALSLPVKFWV